MKKETLKKRIFESAWIIVENEGIEHLSIRRLAELSSCSLGSIYNAFSSFQELILHINATILAKLYQKLHETTELGIKNKHSLRTLLTQLGAAYIEFGQSHRLLWKALFEHSQFEHVPQWYSKHARVGIYQICHRLSEEYELSERESKRIVGFFWASMHGISSILLNNKMEMVAELFNADSLIPYVNYCLEGLFKEVTHV